MEDRYLVKLAELPMNGREVRNVVKTAKLLAPQDGEVLGMEQIAVVLQATRGVILRASLTSRRKFETWGVKERLIMFLCDF